MCDTENQNGGIDAERTVVPSALVRATRLAGAMAVVAISVSIAGCTETQSGSAPSPTRGYAAQNSKVTNFGPYSVRFSRYGCVIEKAAIASQVSLNYTHHNLLITSQDGRTLANYGINCFPVVAGGTAQCIVRDFNLQRVSALAGLGCSQWAGFYLTR